MTNQPGLQLPEGIQRFVAVVDDCRDDGGDLGVSLVQAHAGDLIRVEDIPALIDHFKETLPLEELLTDAWFAGFIASGEGFNGEHPFDGDVTYAMGDSANVNSCNRFIRTALKAFQDNTDSKEAPDA